MAFEIKQLGTLNDIDFRRVVDIDVLRWMKVLSAEDAVEGMAADFDTVWGNEHIRLHERCKRAPDGQLVAYWNDFGPVGEISSLRVRANGADKAPEKWHDLTGKGTLSTHDPDGNTLACISIVTLNAEELNVTKECMEEYKKLHTPKNLIRAQLALAKQLGVEYMIAHSRPWNYASFIEKHGPISIEKYLETINQETGRLYDRAIGIHTSLGGRLLKIIKDGRPLDPEALGYNVIMDYSHLL